ncbi:MAG: efflux RND transporter permease subunit, partial [Oleibacter sp.]|nr:efflux RND transporter permease subunit [Thalassolituus sp.]
MKDSLGISGRVARAFQNSAITPLLAIIGLLLGGFAIMVTPKEEEPQIDVTFANVFIGYPGASVLQVEQLVTIPAERVLSEMPDVDDVFAISQPGQSILTIAFKVGVPREKAIVDLYNQVYSNNDWFPANIGILDPIIRPMGIDDVPIMAITLHGKQQDPSAASDIEVSRSDLSRIANTLATDLKRIPGTRDIYALGERSDVIEVRLDPARLNGYGLAFDDVRQRLLSANHGGFRLPLVQNNEVIEIQAGTLLNKVSDIRQLVVGQSQNGIVYLADVADINQ